MSTAPDAAGDTSAGSAPPPLTVAASPRRRRSNTSPTAFAATEDRDDIRTTAAAISNTTTMTTASLSRKTLPPFVDSDETIHFFNEDMVLRTNAIRIVDDVSAGEQRAATSARRRGGSTRTDDEDRDDDEDESYSDEYYDDDEYDDEYEDECDDDDDGGRRDKARGGSESDDTDSRTAIKARKSNKRLRVRPSEWSSALPKRNSLRSERIPDLAPLYDDVFEVFDDLYSASAASPLALTQSSADESLQRLEWDRKQRKRALSAQSAVATFARRAHAAKSYRSRKRCEFLRVCYQRALETEPLLEDAPDAGVCDALADRVSAAQKDSGAAPPPSSMTSTAASVVLVASRKDDLVEMTVPTLHPRKWPHLPFRAPLQWRGNFSDALDFLTKLAVLPEMSLQYEPVDVAAFVRDVLALLRAVGVDAALDGTSEQSASHSRERDAALPEDAVAGLAALLGLGVQLQSFTLLSLAALQLVVLGRGTRLDDPRAVPPRFKSLLDGYWRRITAQSTRLVFAATYSRALLAQWKISACQPSSSDAIATDGLFLYVFGRTGLFKIGTGNGHTVRDFVYAHNHTYTRSRDAERSWLCCIGAHLYCRTIMMPSNRVDRIATDALDTVEELYFSPNRAVTVKGVSESSVYAMLTDGVHLYTIRCVDTLKRSAQAKPNDRKSKTPVPKATRDPLVDRILKSGTPKSGGDTSGNNAAVASTSEATIKVGDRVVRGPDWKWGSQDGTEGSVGTVERVSTWGGVAGSGVTVRWDKTQRVNTYRWGAEGCYDLVIVVDKDGHVLERKALPTKQAEKDASVPSKSAETPLPRHQFVLFQHDVSCVIATMDLDEDDLDVFLDLGTLDPADTSTGGSGKPSDTIDERALISALHSHPVSLCDWKSSWMCDGGLASCAGNNAAKRYRCDSGCDFDLCETCIRGTLLAKEAKASAGDNTAMGVVDVVSHETSEAASTETLESSGASAAKESELSGDTATQVTSSADAVAVQSLDASSPTNLESNPFAILHASLFYDDASGGSDTPSQLPSEPAVTESDGATAKASETEESAEVSAAVSETAAAVAPVPSEDATTTTTSSTSTATEAPEKDPREREKELVDELYGFWGGLYTRKECLVALRRNNFSLNDASIWIGACAGDLRKKLLVPTVSAVTLTAKPGTGALDPVLLVAGSFYMSSNQLCVVSPPGLYSAGEHQSERMKRAVTSYDAAWFFSTTTGQVLSTDEKDALPVLLRGIPAGSPTCVDSASGHILVYSGYLNCLEVYVDPAHSVAHSLVEREALRDVATLSDMGEKLFTQLHLLMLQRWSSPAYRHPRAGLQDILFRTEREPSQASGSSSKPAAVGTGATTVATTGTSITGTTTGTGTSSESAYSSGQKSKARRIKNIRSRIQMLEEIGRCDPPGYFIPFCIDFEDDGVLHLFRALVVSGSRLSSDATCDATDWRLVNDVLSLLRELSSEIDFAGVSIAGESDDASVRQLYQRTETTLTELARGKRELASSTRDERSADLVASLHSRAIESAQAVLAWGIRRGVFCRDKKASVLVDVGDRIVAAFEREPSVLLVAPPLSGDSAQHDGQVTRFKSARDCEYSFLRALLVCPTDAGRVDVAEFVPLDFDEFARLLATLFRLAALEFRGAALQTPRRAFGVTSVSAVTKALHSLLNYCSVRLYNEKDESLESKSKLKDGARVTPAELFNVFALACIRSSAELLEQYGMHALIGSSGVALSDLQASALGTILPVVLATVSNYPACVSVKVRYGIVDLLKTLDRIAMATTTATPAVTQPADIPSYEAHFEGDQVVESAHPYSQTQSSFRRVVRIPGASVLHIDFDPRSCTSSEADFVFITAGRAWFNSDRMAFAEGGIGDNGGCFFGAYAQGNWPTQGLSIVGDTATIMLCATSQACDNAAHSEKQRWGLRCTVRGLVAPSTPPTWLSDVSAAVACACSAIAEQLMQSVAVQPVEVQCRKWLACRELFRPLERSSVLALRKIVESRKDVLAVLGRFTRLHASPNTSLNTKWADALGFVAAALIAQTDRTVIASLAQNLAAARTAGVATDSLDIANSVRNDVQIIATELQRVEQWMIRHVQLLNEWRYLEEDGVSVDDMKDRYADNADRLRELCELQSVTFHSSDISGCIARLHAQLVMPDAKSHESAQSTSAYQVVAGEVMEKAQLLLSRYARENQQQQQLGGDSAELSLVASTDHQRHRVSIASDFLRSTVSASAVSDCAQIQSKRLKDRIAGFALSESVLAGISKIELSSWFVGRGVVALSSAAGGEIDYLGGCALGDAALLLEFDTLLRKHHAFSANLANDPSKSLLLRSIAVADAYCSARPEDDSNTADDECVSEGLAGTSALICSVDEALVTASVAGSDNILLQTSNAVWILHRLIQEHALSRLQCDSGVHSHSGKRILAVTAATRSLFVYYEHVVESQTLTTTASKSACRMMARILCMVLPLLGAIVEAKDDAVWWIEKALRLLMRAETPVAVSVCAARFCRKVIRACGDRIFDAKIELRGAGLESASSRITLGRDLPGILIERVGKLVSLLPTTMPATAAAVDSASEQFCVVIFLNDETVSKIGVAIEKVAEPDISRWNMQLEAPASESKVQIAESETASASMIHRSVRCDGCDMSPLRGYRFKCFTCPNYDLCTECYTGEKHNVDHEFIRLSDSSSGMGDVLQPRSKGGGTVPETSLVGSKHWKGSIIKVEVTTKGYALYRLGSAADCLATAKELAEIGCLATVVRHSELCEIDRVFGWECQLATTVEPGSARAGRRSTSVQKSTLQKADRATISSMNGAICKQRSTGGALTRRMDDVLALASEVIATVRSVLSDENDMRQWRNTAFQALGSALDNASELLEMPSLQSSECHRRYWEAIGVANVLGGFVEPMRVGGAVTRVSGSTTEAANFGTVQAYALGNNIVEVCVASALDSRGESARASVVECSVSDVKAAAEVPVSVDVIKTLEHLAPSFCAVIKRLHGWLMTNKTSDSSHECLYRSELGCAFMRSFACMAPHWGSLFDNQIISTHGNIPALLFHLAQLCLKDVGLGSVEREREIVWQMEWICAQQLQYSLATRPIKRKSFSAVENADCIFRPPLPPVDSSDSVEPSSSSSSSSNEYFYNLYAYSSRSDIPQHSGRNKLLEYWEKNVIPAIESYVSGSFKSYEMDYFFAQLREPLREGNSAAALKIAYTLCDGHVPSGCVYPDRDTDWSALQIDEVEVGGRYLISTETLDTGGWPREMLWTVGHSGVVRLVNPSGMILLDVRNPMTSEMELWWYHVDSLKPCGAHVRSFADQSVVDFGECGARLLQMNKQLVCSIARRSIFELLQVAPDHVMQLSIDRKSRRSESQLGNRYSLGELLRLAATADLECPDKVAAVDASYTESGYSDSNDSAAGGSRAPLAVAAASAKHLHISMLQSILSKYFDRAPCDRVAPQRTPDEVLPLISKKQTKPVKVAGSSSASFKVSSSSSLLSSSLSLPASPQPDTEPPATPGKYRFMFMESLLRELKKCMASSAAFLQRSSFTVASESPPKPVALVHVPGATCLILSFVVHPVLMDLPPGSSLEFFRDEKCSDRIFGYFGEKKGLNDLPPLVVSGDRCYVKMSQGQYARYKFRVDALTSDFGLALWIGEELYQKLVATAFTGYEVETLLAALMTLLVEYLSTATCLPCSAKIPVFQLVAKLLNFALTKGILSAVPIAKLSSPLVKELTAVFENERTTQSSRFSLYTQQLAELLSLIEEVAHLKGGSAPIVSGAWWSEFVRMAVFTRVLVQGKREASSPEAFSRIYCGRAPIQEIELAHRAVSSRDLVTERLILVQKLPRTTRVDALRAALSRFVLHLSLEECGEADDQSVYSAAEVTRFGIFSQVLHLPVDADGLTKGYAIIDVGREDIIANLLTRMPKEKLEFEGERSAEDGNLAARIAALGTKLSSASGPSGGSGGDDHLDASQDEQVWSCTVCTLENSITESECAACGSPIPPELASISRDLASQSESAPAPAEESSAVSGWACAACTFVNSWSETSCITCSSERGADQVPPASESGPGVGGGNGSDAGQTAGADASDAPARSNVFHELSAVRFSDALQVAEAAAGDDGDDEGDVPQVVDFLRHVFVTTESDGSVRLVDAFVSVLRAEALQTASSAESKRSIEAFTSLMELKCSCDDVGADAFVEQATTRALDAVRTQPLDVFKWLRRAGYDLAFQQSHYLSVDAALQAQAKWTFQMDCQLLAMCRSVSASIGVLMLSELCPSHLAAKTQALEHQHLIAHLETRDLRLRFAVLKSLNRLLLNALPLVNLRPWSDPNALRTRIVSIRQLIFPGVKIRFFAQTADNTSLGCGVSAPESGSKRPMVTLDRRKIVGRRTLDAPLSLADPKRSLFASTRKQLSNISPSQLRAKRPTGASDPFVAFIVLFAGENVVGEGGPYRQLFHDISSELLSPGSTLFIPTANNATKIGEFRERFLPKPSSTSKELLRMFEFVGVLMGCSLRTGVRLNVRLAPIVWKMLVKQSLAFTDLESVDYSLCESLKYLEAEAADSARSASDVLYESFTSTLSDGTVVELKANGRHIPVTKDNCKEYIRLVKASRLQECKPQVDAMLRGISKIVPVQLLQLCVWTELQQWICGSLDINVELLKRHTRYSSGMSPDNFPHLEMFWRVLAGFSEENKRRFINFAWGQDTLPADDAEFDRTHTRLLIKVPPVTDKNQDMLLPKADTCFFNIELPAYSSEEVMREKLLLAITLCTSLDGDDQTGHLDIYYAGDDGEE